MPSPRNVRFVLFSLVLLTIYGRTLWDLAVFAYTSDLFLYILLTPLVSGYFLLKVGRKALSEAAPSYLAGGLAITGGILLYWVGAKVAGQVAQQDLLGITTASLLVTWLGGFLMTYGVKSFQVAAFPIGFMFLMIPIPTGLENWLVGFLQRGSAEAANLLFAMTFLPISRHEFTFSLSSLGIVVAPECSGIRSALYLSLTGLVFAQLFLKSMSRKGLLMLAVLPIAIFKNGLRIASLALLGNYVDKDILSSSLHRQGGIPFMVLGVLFLAVVVELLRRTEKENRESDNRPPSARQCLEAAG